MQRKTLFTSTLIAFVLCASNAQALVTSYGQQQITEAGDGCVGGLVTDHGNTAFFCGDTTLLNRHLASLAAAPPASRHVKVILHAGRHVVDPMEEEPYTGFETQQPSQLAVDWSIGRACVFESVLAGRCEQEPRMVTVHVWIAGRIDINALSIPAAFVVESGREIERLVEQHTGGK